jgi:phage shock protein PspC (stress-responsive transcriptional regulator)
MKKTISINIGGNIFHIEEAGYDKLKAYLDSVHKYFSSFDDSKEIIDDIENRIAEKFYIQLKKTKDAISVEQVEQLIASMGTVADFEATLDEPADQKAKSQTQTQTTDEQPASDTGAAQPAKRLYRDGKSKILGGVAAGIAHYFGIDALWIRLAWILFMFSGIGFFAYIILWIAVPESMELEERKKIKKFFRNPNDRVLGGVASGIAAYFAVDAVIIRILFLVSLFLGGTGFFVYLILWIITPEAKTVTEKMAMEGEPVTLSGIEQNIKKNLNEKEGEESVASKVLLFPFRIISWVINGLGKALGPLFTFLFEAFRVVFGSVILFLGFVMMLTFFLLLLTALGITFSWASYDGLDHVIVQWGLSQFGTWTYVSVFLVAFIPALALALLGITMILKRRVGNAYVGVSMFVIWVIACFAAASTMAPIVKDYAKKDSALTEQRFVMTSETPVLALSKPDNDEMEFYRNINLRLRGHDDSTYLLVVETTARGATNSKARENASLIKYEARQEGNKFLFDSWMTINDKMDFKWQTIEATFYMPLNKVFRMEQNLQEILINTLHLNGYSAYQMQDNDWMFTEDGILCLTCKPTSDYLPDSKSFDYDNFNKVEVSSAFKVRVFQDNSYSVRVTGPEKQVRNIKMGREGKTLVVKHKKRITARMWNERATIHIGMPSLTYFNASGACEGTIDGFDGEELELEIEGKSDFVVNGNSSHMIANVDGLSSLILRGSAKRLTAEVSGSSSLDSYELDAQRVTVKVSGASKAKVQADKDLDISASGASRVDYRGKADVRIDKGGASKVLKD